MTTTASEELKLARKQRHLSQVEAAFILGIPLRTYASWEGSKAVKLHTITVEGALARFAKASAIDAKHATV